jgi:hypothetical protein
MGDVHSASGNKVPYMTSALYTIAIHSMDGARGAPPEPEARAEERRGIRQF